MKPSCLVVAGEKSGEEHVLSFLKDLKVLFPQMEYWGVGGDELRAEGVELLFHLKDFSSWGISEVIGKIPFYFSSLRKIEAEVQKRGCKVAILVDFQEFNLHLSKRLKKMGVEVLYYVAPQAWAWRPWRAQLLARRIHTLFTIIPFEKKWFSDRGVKLVRSVDHPIWGHFKDDLKKYSKLMKREFNTFRSTLRVCVLPGSRNFEVRSLLPEFVDALKLLEAKAARRVVATIVCSPNVNPDIYRPYLKHFDHVANNLELPKVLANSDFALAASGTVTLTTALFEVPTIVCYKTSLLNEFIFSTFLNYTSAISLANIFHQKIVFPELLQNHATAFNIVEKIMPWIVEPAHYEAVIKELQITKNLIRGEDFSVPEYICEVFRHAYHR